MQNESRLLRSARNKEKARASSGKTGYQRLLSSVLALSLLAQVCLATAQAQAPNSASASAPAANAVLAIFSDKPMSNEFWPIIFAALREELASGAPETRFLPGQTVGAGRSSDPAVQILRGDKIVPGLNADNPITIYLHGDCVIPRPRSFSLAPPSVAGALGWVRRNHGQIEHFIHVECTRLAQMLASQAYGLDRDQRNGLMAVAIARVILHEWIHIATQNPGHAPDGLGKAAFRPPDLVAHAANPAADETAAQTAETKGNWKPVPPARPPTTTPGCAADHAECESTRPATESRR